MKSSPTFPRADYNEDAVVITPQTYNDIVSAIEQFGRIGAGRGIAINDSTSGKVITCTLAVNRMFFGKIVTSGWNNQITAGLVVLGGDVFLEQLTENGAIEIILVELNAGCEFIEQMAIHDA